MKFKLALVTAAASEMSLWDCLHCSKLLHDQNSFEYRKTWNLAKNLEYMILMERKASL